LEDIERRFGTIHRQVVPKRRWLPAFTA